MRTLAVTQNITIDGRIEMIGDWFSEQGQGGEDPSDYLEVMHEHDLRADALLLGRQTFLDMRAYWPHATDDRTGIRSYLNSVQKYVVSATLAEPEWQNSTVVSTGPIARIAALKAEPGKDIVITGSISLTHALIAAGLVDEYRLFVYPVVQGQGRRLFPEGFTAPRLRLTEARPFRSGVTLLSYAAA